MNRLKQFFNDQSKRVVACPSCGARSKVPVKPGKTLLVHCPSCEAKFEIQFSSPSDAWKQLLKNPFSTDINKNKWTPFFIGLLILLLFKSCFVSGPRQATPNAPEAVKTPAQSDVPVIDL